MKSIRLKNYDYSSNGSYFITVCTEKKRCILGRTVGQGLCSCQLTDIGKIVESEIDNIEKRFSGVFIDNYIVMPNHIHLLISLERQEQSPCPTVGEIICTLKSITTRKANVVENKKGRKIWQARYYDHVVRNSDDYENIWNYIEYNTAKWNEDRFFLNELECKK